MSCPIQYNLSITGDCSVSNSGEIVLDINGVSPFTVSWISPIVESAQFFPTSPATYNVNGLSAGTYSLQIVDGCLDPGSQTTYVNFTISSGTCVNIEDISNTLCNENNGSITATTSSFYGNAQFSLYETTLGFITSGGTTLSGYYEFNSLSPGTYYVIGNDGGGCTGKSETCIIKSSTTLDYGLYIINNPGCGSNLGSIYVTGLTGNPPYTYLWSNLETTSFITGLTDGNSYSVNVTDNTGCQVTKSGYVGKVDSVGLGSFITTAPTCLNSDGEIKVIITGGTGPYYYWLSNGSSIITFSNSHTFTGLSSAEYTLIVTDAGLCSFTSTIDLYGPNIFSVTSANIANSLCNNDDGQLSVTIFGSSGIYNFSLTGGSVNQTYTVNSITPTFTQLFQNLPSGTYTLTVYNNALPDCQFIQNYTINNTVKFDVTLETTGTTCGLNNGQVSITLGSGGTPPYVYNITSQIISTGSSAHTFNNLSSGSYVLSVTDSTGCEQTQPFIITPSTGVNFTLVGTNATAGNNGTISALITEGEPPFTLNWSPNVGGQTSLTVTGLSAGTYYLTVTDNNGCVFTRPAVQLFGYNNISAYQVYNVCDTNFQNSGELVKKGPKQMLIEGFHDLTINDLNCILVQSIFTAKININGVITTTPFFTGTTLNDAPTEEEWFTLIGNLVSAYDGIKEVIVKPSTNELIVITLCGDIDFNNADVIIDLIIDYEISCVECSMITI